MFVTSDIFDLKGIGHYRDFDWQENLLCGVAVHGTQAPDPTAFASFLLEAAKCCGILGEMKYAGYEPGVAKGSRSIAPKSVARLAQGGLAGAKDAVKVWLTGVRVAAGSQNDVIYFGGDAGRLRGPNSVGPTLNSSDQTFDGAFVFPLDEHPLEEAVELFQLAVDILGAEYGYYFVRDDLCFPGAYPLGIGAPLDYSPLATDETLEINGWRRFVKRTLWTGDWPLLRDLYQMNLLSNRHTSAPIEGLGYLTEWIAAQPGRGRLKEMGRGRLLWTLTDAELFDVRPQLNEAGLLLSCRDRVYRDLPEGPANRRVHSQSRRPLAYLSPDFPTRPTPPHKPPA